ncbi:MAG: M50 family metallopeptidase [Bifidobacterium crudilactis]|nr:M50 family metallopeptidase [Bifidobacterium crudilactis]
MVETVAIASTGDDLSTIFGTIWTASTPALEQPDSRTMLIALAISLILILLRPLWRIARNVITIAHEGGHAVAALLTGRRLSGIQLHSDTSGLTVSYGKTRGFGFWLTCFSGYLAPMLWGLGCAALVSSGYATGALWLLVLLLALMLTRIRNIYGAFCIISVLATVIALSWWGSPQLRLLSATSLAFFLQLGSIRPLLELQSQRAKGQAGRSDADQLAQLTRIPALAWIILWSVLAFLGIALSASWMGLRI